MTLATSVRILVVGSGGREHALAWKLAAEPGVRRVIVAPGSAGIATERGVECAALDPLDPGAVVALARQASIDLVVIGPEAPLAAGVADALEAAGIATFGPTAAAARIETSKAFCHEVTEAAGVPMARAIVARDRDAAGIAVATLAEIGQGFVVKEDGLAAGKGVVVFGPDSGAREADPLLDGLYADDPARTVVVEERLEGPEASVIAVCDGRRAVALPAARDHKRLGDGDTGPNTGGMGAYAPLPDLDETAVEEIVRTVHEPILAELARRGTPFRGFLYAGLMLTADGPRLLECNARLGDPETQVLLPRLAGPLAPVLLAAAAGALAEHPATHLATRTGASVGIVLAAAGYPAKPRRGDRITGLRLAAERGALVFHAGTAFDGEAFRTAGGRVLTVVGSGADLAEARAAAEAGARSVEFDGLQRRTDIAAVDRLADLALPGTRARAGVPAGLAGASR